MLKIIDFFFSFQYCITFIVSAFWIFIELVFLNKIKNFWNTVKLGYNELGYDELGYNELGYDELGYNKHPVELNWIEFYFGLTFT